VVLAGGCSGTVERRTEDGGLGRDAPVADAGPAGDVLDAPRPSQDAPADVPNSCQGVTCSGHGTCIVADGGVASCSCEAGYHAVGLTCVQDETCAGVTCGRCATCKVIGGVAQCTCPEGFRLEGNGCVVDPDPCATIDCGPDKACVPEAHCQPLGACVDTCDCSNCGNCGPDNSDGRWNDWQEYCGNLNSQPATMRCNKPCPPGEGCLPYSPAICWPMEGCFSL